MLRPRNTLVTVAEIKSGELKLESGIIIPSGTSQEYKLCTIVAVGPGMLTSQSDINPSADLSPGQTVLVKLAQQVRVSQDMVGLKPIGVDFKTEDGRNITIVEQTQIVAIVELDPSQIAGRIASE